MSAAFDKGDLLYLRDEEEKRRFTEMELRDSEQQQFRKERARVEAEHAAAALRAAQARKDKQGRYSNANRTPKHHRHVYKQFTQEMPYICCLRVVLEAGCMKVTLTLLLSATLPKLGSSPATSCEAMSYRVNISLHVNRCVQEPTYHHCSSLLLIKSLSSTSPTTCYAARCNAHFRVVQTAAKSQHQCSTDKALKRTEQQLS